MRKIFGSLLGKGSKESSHASVALITNSSACVLGQNVLMGLSQRGKVVNFDRNLDALENLDPSLRSKGVIENIIPF